MTTNSDYLFIGKDIHNKHYPDYGDYNDKLFVLANNS